MNLFSFKKKDRLTLTSQIDALFRDGKVLYSGNLRVVYRLENKDSGVKVLVSVPRKKFRKAVDRNRIKRLIREAYRIHRHILLPETPATAGCLHTGFIYTGERKDIGFTDIETNMINALNLLAKEFSVKSPKG